MCPDKEKWLAAKLTQESMDEMTERMYKRTAEIHKVPLTSFRPV